MTQRRVAALIGSPVAHSLSPVIHQAAFDAAGDDWIYAAFDVAHEAGALVTYDPNVRVKLWPLPRARAIVLASLARCHWCLPSQDDADVLFPGAAADAVVDAIHRAGARGVVLKQGRDGCIVSDGVRRERIAAHRVASVDATGAGDCFDGAFAARLVAGDDPFAAARFANAAAALATMGYGAVAPLPRAADVAVLAGLEARA